MDFLTILSLLSTIITPVIAITALILSQKPPIKDWKPIINLQIAIPNKIYIENTLGIIAYTIPVGIKNTGNRETTISSIQLKVELLDSKSVGTTEFYGEGYYSFSSNMQPYVIPITNITLKEKETWNGSLFFTPKLEQETEENMNIIRQELYSAIIHRGYFNPFNSSSGYKEINDLDNSLVDKAKEFFNRNFKLKKGNYQATLNIYINDNEFNFEKCFEFIIYDFHKKTIKLRAEAYTSTRRRSAKIYLVGCTPPHISCANWAKNLWKFHNFSPIQRIERSDYPPAPYIH